MWFVRVRGVDAAKLVGVYFQLRPIYLFNYLCESDFYARLDLFLSITFAEILTRVCVFCILGVHIVSSLEPIFIELIPTNDE